MISTSNRFRTTEALSAKPRMRRMPWDRTGNTGRPKRDEDQQQIDAMADNFVGFWHWAEVRAVPPMLQELDGHLIKELAPDLSRAEG
jgi:hypothetical protein